MASQISSREFNQDTSRAKKAAKHGPVYITDRGRPAHVLLTFEAYEHLLGTQRVVERLAEPTGIEDIDLTLHISEETARPATFD